MRDDREGWIFPSPHAHSAAGHRACMDRRFRDAVKAAGFDPELITPHVMRHTAITKLVQAGVDLRVSGHKTPAMVLRYTHVHGSHIDGRFAPSGARFRTQRVQLRRPARREKIIMKGTRTVRAIIIRDAVMCWLVDNGRDERINGLALLRRGQVGDFTILHRTPFRDFPSAPRSRESTQKRCCCSNADCSTCHRGSTFGTGAVAGLALRPSTEASGRLICLE